VLIAAGDKHVLIDPGHFSDQSALALADAVLVTHDHFDHLDPATLAAHMNAHAAVEVWAPSNSHRLLVEAGADADRLHLVAPGDEFTAGGLSVQVFGGDHAVMFADVPCSQNIGFVVDGDLVHPGDSFAQPPAGITPRVLLLPVSAPWLTVNDVVTYARAVSPEIAIPIHDAILSDAGRGVFDRIVGSAPGLESYRRIPAGEDTPV
jgi:L-ascorbate metabolism protein UlaG (beta-lactamase superfamily)